MELPKVNYKWVDQFVVTVGSKWDYDRSLCNSRNTTGLEVVSVDDKWVTFKEKMAFKRWGIEYFDGKTFRPHVPRVF